MLRNVYEAVTNSCYSIFDDNTLSRRMEASEGINLVPARVLFENGQWKLQLFNGKPQGCEKPLQPAGWIRRYERLNGRQAQRPIVEIGNFKHGDEAWAAMKLTIPERSRVAFWDVRGLFKTEEEAIQWSSQQRESFEIEKGWVYISFQNIENKHDERFFFGNGKAIDLTKEVYDDYCLLVKDYKKRHKEELEDERRKLPQGRKPALSKFIWGKCDLQDGDLVYACIQNDQLQYIIPVQISRRPYKNSTGELLPECLLPCKEYHRLCPACRLFGWVKNKTKESEETGKRQLVKDAYNGRVKVSMGQLSKDTGTTGGITLAELAGPKPTTTFFYLTKKNSHDGFVAKREGYNFIYQHLRGRKLYRHHQHFVWKTGEKTNRNRTINEVVNPESKFEFTIRFHNLSSLELGALAWCLKLEEGMYHRLGYGKPLGLGSIAISIDCCKIYQMARRYTDPADTGEEEIDINNYIQDFKDTCKKAYGKEFLALENILDLKSILSKTKDDFPIQYPRPIKEANDPGPGEENFEWFKPEFPRNYT